MGDFEPSRFDAAAFSVGEQPQPDHRPGVRILPEARVKRVGINDVRGGWSSRTEASVSSNRRSR